MKLYSFLVLACLVLLSSAAPSYSSKFDTQIADEDLLEICKKTLNLTFCLETFKSKPETPTADVKRLCQISIDMATAEATTIVNTLNSFCGLGGLDPVLKTRCDTCHQLYNETLGIFQECTRYLEMSSGVLVAETARDAYDHIMNCRAQFETPPYGGAGEWYKGYILNRYANMIYVLAGYF